MLSAYTSTSSQKQTALQRWQTHDFLEIERGAAKDCRAELAAQDPRNVIGTLRNALPPYATLPDLERLKSFVDGICESNDRRMVRLALDRLGVLRSIGARLSSAGSQRETLPSLTSCPTPRTS